MISTYIIFSSIIAITAIIAPILKDLFIARYNFSQQEKRKIAYDLIDVCCKPLSEIDANFPQIQNIVYKLFLFTKTKNQEALNELLAIFAERDAILLLANTNPNFEQNIDDINVRMLKKLREVMFALKKELSRF